jgi:hypothetical protein
MKNSPRDDFNTPAFRNMIEDHLTWLINHPMTQSTPVTAHQVDVYDFDWIGLLNALRIIPDLHWITIRMNGGNSYTDVPQDLRKVLVPDITTIQNLTMLDNSKKKIK